MRFILVLVLLIVAASAVPSHIGRIAGGSYTTINNYPSMASLAYSHDLVTYLHDCGGTILNNRAILTAAHCVLRGTERQRIRLGSTYSTRGGDIYRFSRIILHPNYNINWGVDSDIAIVHTERFITYTDVIQPGSFAGANYNVPDGTSVWGTGWGSTGEEPRSEQLKQVELWILNHSTCNGIYSGIVNDRMICVLPSGDGHGQCSADSGGPLYHGNVIIGVLSFGSIICGSGTLPTVSVSVANYISWIQANA